MEDLNILVQRKEDLAKKIKEIEELAAESTEKILDAIKNQRWYFFEERSQIIFDRDTGLLWANLDHFPWKKDVGDQLVYSDENEYEEVKNVLEEINSQNFGGYEDWTIPTHLELWNLVEDKTFPFCEGNNWNIKKRCYWCVNYKNRLASKDLDDSPADEDIRFDHSVFVIPCSHIFASENFSGDPKEILEIFDKNNLIPQFDDDEVTQIYRKVFVEKIMARKQSISNQIMEIEKEIYKIENEEPLSTVNFDYKVLLEKYDTREIEKSPIKYYKSVFDLSFDMLRVLHEYAYTYRNIISEFSQVTVALEDKHEPNPKLSAEGQAFLEERQKFLARHLKPGIESIRNQIFAVKAQAEEFSARIEKINQSDNSIKEFAELEKEPRVSFEFLAENLGNLILEAQKRVDFFILHKKFVADVIHQWEIWSKDYESFEVNLCEEFVGICQKDGIAKNISAAWAEDWKKKRFVIEERFLPLVEYCLKGNFLDDSGANTLKILQAYKEDIDKFYLNDRKNIYKQFSSANDNGLKEKLATEISIHKLNEKFQHKLKEIIFSREKKEEQHYLVIWSKPLLNIPIDDILEFIDENHFEEIPTKILAQFEELKNRSFASYLSDSRKYNQAIEDYEKDFDAIMIEIKKIYQAK